jgi:FHA domain
LETLCFRHDFLVERFRVNASQEEGAWLEAADGKRHPIHGSCSVGRIPANTIVLESSKVSRRHALIHLQNIGEFWLIVPADILAKPLAQRVGEDGFWTGGFSRDSRAEIVNGRLLVDELILASKACLSKGCSFRL